MSSRQAATLAPLPGAALRLPRSVAVVSGKGGVGKTNLVANLAVAAAGLRARVLVVDGDLGLANMDVLLGLAPPHSVADVLEGRCTLDAALVEGPRGVHLLPAAGGRTELAAPDPGRLARLLALLEPRAARYDLVLVDAGAGIGPAVMGLASACERILLVTTREPTSFADAYATLKVLSRRPGAARPELVVNAARDEREARDVHDQLARLARRFLDTEVSFCGALPHDERLARAVARQRAVVELYPNSAASRRMTELAQTLLARSAPSDAAASGPATTA